MYLTIIIKEKETIHLRANGKEFKRKIAVGGGVRREKDERSVIFF